MNEIECDICNKDVPRRGTIENLSQHFDGVAGLDVMCYNCIVSIIGANVSAKTLQRFVDR